MEHTSRLDEIYINASTEEKEVLWKLYDHFFCTIILRQRTMASKIIRRKKMIKIFII